MADPRNQIDYTGLGKRLDPFIVDGVTITYDITKVQGSAQVGLAVTFSADRTVALCQDGNAVIGRLEQVESDGKCAVQTEGWMQLPGGASASLTRGSKIVGALGTAAARGYIRNVASATAAELAVAKGMIGDVSDTTNVWVEY